MNSIFWMLAYLLIDCNSYVGRTHARTLESTELLVGDWDVAIHCKTKHHDIFHPLRSTEASLTIAPRNKKLFPLMASRNFRPRHRELSCRLSMFSNRTFELRPVPSLTNAGLGEDEVLAVHGKWSVQSNPYCATDRFYDDVHLVSYPRVQKQCTGENGEESTSRVLQRIEFNMHCRLYGHFTDGGLLRKLVGPEKYYRGKMKQGRIIRNRQVPTMSGARKLSRHVIASFSGRRWMPPFLQILDAVEEEDLKNYELYRD